MARTGIARSLFAVLCLFSAFAIRSSAQDTSPSQESSLTLVVASLSAGELGFNIANPEAQVTYELLSSTNLGLPMVEWHSEGIWPNPANSQLNVQVSSDLQPRFFRAQLWDGTFSHGAPASGQLFLRLSTTNPIQALVNGVTNTLTPFYSNWVAVTPPVYELNAGYDQSDDGPQFISDFPQQEIVELVGYSTTTSNLCLSYNPITNIDVHGWPNLRYLECWHCTNLVSANFTNCPELTRVCVESTDDLEHGIDGLLDLTGCPNLADLRAAQNNFTNIVFGNAGEKLWHLCIRDNHNDIDPPPKLAPLPFSKLPALRELWIWGDAAFEQPLVLTTTNCPQLISVEADGNAFTDAIFSGQTNLDHIYMFGNWGLTNVDITGCLNLTYVELGRCSLPSAMVDHVLVTLDNLPNSSDIAGYVNLDNDIDAGLGDNEPPSAAGIAAAESLQSKGWLVGYPTPP